jgi:hypothetical protein
MSEQRTRARAPAVDVEKRKRAPYTRPVLRVHGTVAAFTQGTLSTNNDPGGSNSGKS